MYLALTDGSGRRTYRFRRPTSRGHFRADEHGRRAIEETAHTETSLKEEVTLAVDRLLLLLLARVELFFHPPFARRVSCFSARFFEDKREVEARAAAGV